MSKDRDKDAPDLSPSDAEAPGPITPEHESGSWEQHVEEHGKPEEESKPKPKPSSSKS